MSFVPSCGGAGCLAGGVGAGGRLRHAGVPRRPARPVHDGRQLHRVQWGQPVHHRRIRHPLSHRGHRRPRLAALVGGEAPRPSTPSGSGTIRISVEASRAPSPSRWPNDSTSRRTMSGSSPSASTSRSLPETRTSTSRSSRSRTWRHRAKNVDFSEGYYDVSQALVSVRGSPIAGATSVQDLKVAYAGAPTGAGSLAYIEDTIHPKTPPTAYADLRAAVRALQNGHVDGIVADLPNAAFVSDELAGGVLVGRLRAPARRSTSRWRSRRGVRSWSA